ncbi:MAG: Fpg/Nei family DNA glycosylase [Acidimicrobiia bacterium]|nr:Fpg/Nei family DNA glycosylase [Acidimicrobiia bacterium]
MPEGHTIHRHARRHRAAIAGQPVRTGSPQGRFSAGAKRLDGRVLEGIDAHGKHLFYRWEGGWILHIHLGLFGKFRLYRSDPPPPSENARLTMAGDDATIYLSGPTMCELIDPGRELAIRSRLGPDPLLNGSTAAKIKAFGSNLARRRIPIGAALLNQQVISGIGNVYRAEVLFRAGIDPHLPANRLSAETVDRLWREAAAQLRLGEKAGRIITVDLSDVDAKRRSDLRRLERVYVYKRHGEPCRRCATPISTTDMANRRMWWCATCQPPGAGS